MEDNEEKFKNAKSLGETRDTRLPLKDIEAFGHLMKGTVGTGILATPLAFKKSGTWAGLVATIFLGALIYYSQHMLVKCAHIMCWRLKRPTLTYEELMEVSFQDGTAKGERTSKSMKYVTMVVLASFMFGCCCVYVVFVAVNVKAVVKELWMEIDERIFMAIIIVPVCLLNMIRTLKFMAPASIIAVCIMFSVLCICMYYIIANYKSPFRLPALAPPIDWPMYFGMVVFGLQGIATVLAVENSMKTPEHLITFPYLILIEMVSVTAVTCMFGLLGYAAYGDKIEASISLNLPKDVVSKIAKLLLSAVMFLSIALYFYVPYNMIYSRIKGKFEKHPDLYDYLLRYAFSLAIVAVAVIVPTIGPFITLLGAVCQSLLGFIFPAILEIVIYWKDPGMGVGYWRLIKNLLMIWFGLLGAGSGSYVALLEIIALYRKMTSNSNE